MRNFKFAALAAAATLAAVTPSIASAQNTTVADPTYSAPVNDDDDDEFPVGLLGLLGLAGLLGLKRRDDHVHHDHTDRTRS